MFDPFDLSDRWTRAMVVVVASGVAALALPAYRYWLGFASLLAVTMKLFIAWRGRQPASNSSLAKLPVHVRQQLAGLGRVVTHNDIAQVVTKRKCALAAQRRRQRAAEERRRQAVRAEVLAAIDAEIAQRQAMALRPDSADASAARI